MKPLRDSLFHDPDPEIPLVQRVDKSLVVAFVAAVGIDLECAENSAQKKLQDCGYKVVRIRVTKDVLPVLDQSVTREYPCGQFERFNTMMDAGNAARAKKGNWIIGAGIANAIALARNYSESPENKVAYLVHSLKHPEEVRVLRRIYSAGFYLIGVHAPSEDRRAHLTKKRGMTLDQANKLMDRDRKENQIYGQKLVDTFHLSDYFVGWRESGRPEDLSFMENNISRFFEIVFGHPNRTPTFGEYAMFHAFSAALRSADLSRQVGAVVTRRREILGSGANECPQAGGGLYWPTLNKENQQFEDHPRGRDYTREKDANRHKLLELKVKVLSKSKEAFVHVLDEAFSKLDDIQDEAHREVIDDLHDSLRDELVRRLDVVLESSPIADLTEFGRVVHAEMEALLSCARKGVSTVDTTLFSTTFPCHNCAKHIVAAGVRKVVFIEPYLKSKAFELHDDAIEITYPKPFDYEEMHKNQVKVEFEPFVGIGPRRFFDLFSMNLGVGKPVQRKDSKSGAATKWQDPIAEPRIQLSADSFLDREREAAEIFGGVVLGNR